MLVYEYRSLVDVQFDNFLSINQENRDSLAHHCDDHIRTLFDKKNASPLWVPGGVRPTWNQIKYFADQAKYFADEAKYHADQTEYSADQTKHFADMTKCHANQTKYLADMTKSFTNQTKYFIKGPGPGAGGPGQVQATGQVACTGCTSDIALIYLSKEHICK